MKHVEISDRAQERAARAALYPKSRNVIAAPVNPPKDPRDDDSSRNPQHGERSRLKQPHG